jgi:hypothetical protein
VRKHVAESIEGLRANAIERQVAAEETQAFVARGLRVRGEIRQ